MPAPELIKSAARAFEVMEVFAAERRRLSAVQLGAKLDYPRSSLNVLLKSLVAQGYLSYEPGDLSYLPTLRLAQLGEWLPKALSYNETLRAELEALRDRTGETVTLTMPAGLEMRVLVALIGTAPIALYLDERNAIPMSGTAVGAAYLSTLEPGALKRAVARLSALRGRDAGSDVAADLAEIAEARAAGMAAAYDRVLPDVGAIAMPLRKSGRDETLVVAVAGLNRRIRQNAGRIEAELRATIRRLMA